ncbi:MAG TPA: response regulator, partial [Burkholderiaceae bacterium]
GAPLKILVADDNVDAAATLSTMLKMLGHKVRVVHGGRQALEAASEFKPEIVFLDIGMPDMSGYDVAAQLRASLNPTLAALTGWGAEADKARAQQAGFDHHLTKPAALASVNDVLLRHAERR